jgi:hypothetical protein
MSEFVYKPGMRIIIKRTDGVGEEFIGTLEDLYILSLTREVKYQPRDDKKYVITATRRIKPHEGASAKGGPKL